MKYPEEIKKRAYELYVEGISNQQIISKISKEFDAIIRSETINLWAKEEDWKESRALARANAYNDVTTRQTKTLADYMQNQLEHMEKLNKVTIKANDELEYLPFEKAEGAAKALVDSTQAYNKLAKGMIEIKFVEALINVLLEEIPDDPELLKRIQIKFQKILQEEI